MSGHDKTNEDRSINQHAEDIELDPEMAGKPTAVANAPKGADRAAQLIGDQHVEMTEEDVSQIAGKAQRLGDSQCLITEQTHSPKDRQAYSLYPGLGLLPSNPR